MSLKAARLAALIVTLASASGCSLLGSNGPSEVARGEYYAAGKPEFDSFFIALHEKQVALLAAPQEPADARKNLTRIMGLSADASDSSLKDRLRQELEKLASQGLRVRLEVPEPSSTLDASATLYASDSANAAPLRATLTQEATRLVRSRNRMVAGKAELEKLTVTGITLEGNVDQAFRVDGPWKRDEVRKNLADGQKLITLMQARAQEVIDLDQKLLALLVDVASTDPNLGKAPAYVPPAPAEDAPKPGKRAPATRSTPSPRPAPATTAARPVAAAPRPAPKGGNEEAPAPKPVQGNAPAEIEP